jgi:hypothetical protein
MFTLKYTPEAKSTYAVMKAKAVASLQARKKNHKAKSTQDEGLFKQVHKTLELLQNNPRHPGLQTHEYQSMPNPVNKKQKVFEAYAQNKTPGAYRVFWCYGPNPKEMTIIAITPHP